MERSRIFLRNELILDSVQELVGQEVVGGFRSMDTLLREVDNPIVRITNVELMRTGLHELDSKLSTETTLRNGVVHSLCKSFELFRHSILIDFARSIDLFFLCLCQLGVTLAAELLCGILVLGVKALIAVCIGGIETTALNILNTLRGQEIIDRFLTVLLGSTLF